MDNNGVEQTEITAGGFFFVGFAIATLICIIVIVLVAIPEFRAQGRCFPNEVIDYTMNYAICQTLDGKEELKRTSK